MAENIHKSTEKTKTKRTIQFTCDDEYMKIVLAFFSFAEDGINFKDITYEPTILLPNIVSYTDTISC